MRGGAAWGLESDGMKAFFLCCAAALVLASAATVLTGPEMPSDVPVITWVTDNNPARGEQIELFHKWLLKHGHTTPDGRPCVELRLDTASRDGDKQVIQGVSGVAADIMDCDITRFQRLGLLEDVTGAAEKLRFDMSHTYAALGPLLTVDGRQYGFPCNVNSRAFWVNVDTLARHGLDPPPRTWDFETFERLGKEFVRRANPPGRPRRVFFATAVRSYLGRPIVRVMHRSLGLSDFNETLTGCTLDDPRYARVLGLIHKWTHADHIFPSAADEASFASETGYGGAVLSLFQRGHYAMISIGRWCLIRIRRFDRPPRLAVSRYPCEDFANAPIDARAAGLYAGGRHKDQAVLFLAFLASGDYNEHVVRDADALPPDPRFTRSQAYLRPEGHRNEWGCHEVPVRAAETVAIGPAVSPFVPRGILERHKEQGLEKVMANLAAPAEAARWTARRVDEEIRRTLEASAMLRAHYEELLAVQRKIDARLAAGRPVPAEWIRNPFHRRYYAWKGYLEDRTR
jgi:multiple sugar transport system substrate-binding protein